MDIVEALKQGVIPPTMHPIDIVITAEKEGLTELLNKVIKSHRRMVKKMTDPAIVRKKFGLACDFSPAELSTMVDMDIWTKTATDDYNNYSSAESAFRIMGSLKRKKLYRPINDATVLACYRCNLVFSLFNRKHHCRACGRIFCNNCAQWYECIPEACISYIDTKNWVTANQNARVCYNCRDAIMNFRKIERIIQYFEIVSYPFDSCIKLSTLCRDWREAVRIYLSNIRDYQYILPATPLKPEMKKVLSSQLPKFIGHSNWLLQALKLGICPIDGPRVASCSDMMCDNNCEEELSMYDAITILNTPLYNVEVKLLAVKILEKYIVPAHLTIFLPLEDVSIQEFILKHPELFLNFFWLSQINTDRASEVFRNKLLLANQQQGQIVQESLHLISALANFTTVYELSQKLQRLRVPFMGPFGQIDRFDYDITVKNSVTKPIIVRYYDQGHHRAFLYKNEDIRKDAHIISIIHLMYHLCDDIFEELANFLPPKSTPIVIGSSSSDLHGRNYSPISSAESHSRSLPTFISMGSPSNSPDDFSILPCLEAKFKPKKPRSESSSLSSSVNSNNPTSPSNYLVTYRVAPVSVDSGFIEIVPNSRTLYDILSRGTISNYLYSSNTDKKIGEISSNYSASLAFWTVITFILGVGDRHLENIMIRSDGILFHIDYGFVFGADTTASLVRLDNNLIEGLGGSDMYESFKQRCCEIYSCLRRHCSLICSCASRLSYVQPPIKGYKLTPEFIENFVTERFLLGQTEEEASEAFSKIIDASRENIISKVSDVIHNTMSSFKVRWWS